MSQNMKALKRCFPIQSFITLAENFGKWRPYLELFFFGGGYRGSEISLGAAAPPAPLGIAPAYDTYSE